MRRRFATAVGLLMLVGMVTAALFAHQATAAALTPRVSGNALVDLDHNLAFPQNK